MQRMLDESRSRAWPADVTTSAFRILFFITVGVGGIVFWLAPHPPMNDLPQHAAQVATLHDLLLGQSPWDRLLRINLFTPYLLGYVLAVGLSFVMPVAAALKVLLTLSFYGFVAAYVALRKHVGGDERLDWLCVPGFFGFAYAYGFFSYLVAAPIGMFLLVTARDYAEQPSARRGTSRARRFQCRVVPAADRPIPARPGAGRGAVGCRAGAIERALRLAQASGQVVSVFLRPAYVADTRRIVRERGVSCC